MTEEQKRSAREDYRKGLDTYDIEKRLGGLVSEAQIYNAVFGTRAESIKERGKDK